MNTFTSLEVFRKDQEVCQKNEFCIAKGKFVEYKKNFPKLIALYSRVFIVM